MILDLMLTLTLNLPRNYWLQDLEAYVTEFVKDRPIVCWCMELDTLRADLGARHWSSARPFSATSARSRTHTVSAALEAHAVRGLLHCRSVWICRSPRVSAQGPPVQVFVGVQAGFLHQAARLLEGEPVDGSSAP